MHVFLRREIVLDYLDEFGTKCTLSFEKDTFVLESRHVLVICRVDDKWLLTRHTARGLEFPGGKVEPGETLETAAVREVKEETGFTACGLEWFAAYQVDGEQPFVKTVFVANAEGAAYFQPMETMGPVLMDSVEPDDTYSFLMKDEGMREIIRQVKHIAKWND